MFERLFWFTTKSMWSSNLGLGFMCLLDGLVLIISFGLIGSSFQWHYAARRELRIINKSKTDKTKKGS
jgi:hypothetical protein